MEGQGAAPFDAPPPPSGLGNFKGVMLCNRPSDEVKAVAEDPMPFRSAVASNSEVGLRPLRNYEPTVKKRGPSAALRRHVRWLRELQEQMREDRNQAEQEEHDEVAKRIKLKTAFDKHREAVRGMMQERSDKRREEEATAKAEKAAKAAEAKAAAQSAQPALSEIARAAAAAVEGKVSAKAQSAKPLWAMTAQEKDKFEEDEADDLINFAEGLDFDEYVADLEFRQALGALKDRAGKLMKEQEAFKDDLLASFAEEYEESTAAGSSKAEDGVDGQSLFGDHRSEYSVASSRRSRRKEVQENGQKEWDSSTAAGEDRPAIDPEVKGMAEAVLEQHPKFRAIHSKDSVQKVIEKVRADQALDVP
ncbi:unnamed protein product [Symbiodinium sp. CCMP2456]|nr:unnamed protein product [Symbiodinium sp. CCMP2456]